ncbi:hypothetical protein BH09MYX1_BH09MYX1_23310 [soil metagenome]
MSYVIDWMLHVPPRDAAATLDAIALRAEEGDEIAKEALVAIVDAFGSPQVESVRQVLREEVADASLISLERLLRAPLPPLRPSQKPPKPPDYGFGRPLTLGERKSLARKPDRKMLEKLLLDPHPDVIRGLLRNPRLTEDDLIRVAARRPGRPDVLREIARAEAWAHRPRIRLAIMLNPVSPLDVTIPLAGLLLRHELRLVGYSTYVAAPLRAVCLEHLARKYPHGDDGSSELQ